MKDLIQRKYGFISFVVVDITIGRHIFVVSYTVNFVDPKYTVYSDLPGHTAPAGGSIPLNSV